LEIDQEFLLIVTNKELSVGRGSVLKEIYTDGILNVPSNEISRRLPLSNVYVVSIDDFERMMEACRLGEIYLPDFLNECVENDNNPELSKYYMEQHLAAARISNHVSELVSEAFKNSINRFQEIPE